MGINLINTLYYNVSLLKPKVSIMLKFKLFHIERKVTLCVCDTKEEAERIKKLLNDEFNKVVIEDVFYIDEDTIRFFEKLKKGGEL